MLLCVRCLAPSGVDCQVEFGALSDEAIRAYVNTGEPMDKAGGYGIQVRIELCFSSDHFRKFGRNSMCICDNTWHPTLSIA